MIVRLTGRMIDYLVPARLFWDGRLIYRPLGFATQAPIKPGSTGWTSEEVFAKEKFLVEHVDGVFHWFSPMASDQLRRDGMDIRCPVEAIYPSCVWELGPHRRLDRLSRRTGETHLVYAGGLSGSDAMSGEFKLWEKWRRIVSQGLHIHAYNASGEWEEPRFVEYRRVAEESPYLHLEETIEFDDLLVALTQYDYALQYWDFMQRRVKLGYNYHLSNGFWTYLQAGLPVIVSAPPWARPTLSCALASESSCQRRISISCGSCWRSRIGGS